MGELLWRQARNIQKGNVGPPAWKPTPETGVLREMGLYPGFKTQLSIWLLLLPMRLGSRRAYFELH